MKIEFKILEKEGMWTQIQIHSRTITVTVMR